MIRVLSNKYNMPALFYPHTILYAALSTCCFFDSLKKCAIHNFWLKRTSKYGRKSTNYSKLIWNVARTIFFVTILQGILAISWGRETSTKKHVRTKS